MNKGTIAALDIGTSKICALLGRRESDDSVAILAAVTEPSLGMKNSVVNDLAEIAASVSQAVMRLEKESRQELTSVFINFGGQQIRNRLAPAIVSISGREREINRSDIEQVTRLAKLQALPLDEKVLLETPQSFIVDEEEGIKNPLGMYARRLGVRLHLITTNFTVLRNIVSSVNRTGLEVEGVVPSGFAVTRAVLDKESRRLCVLDIGAGTSDVTLLTDGVIEKIEVIGVGAQALTEAISRRFRTSFDYAEVVKKRFGCALPRLVDKNEKIEIAGGQVRSRLTTRREIAEVLGKKMKEFFRSLEEILQSSGGAESRDGGMVITGGGALLEGLAEAAEDYFKLPVRLGMNRGLTGCAPELAGPLYATGVGLLRYGAEYRKNCPRPGVPFIKKPWERIKNLFEGYF